MCVYIYHYIYNYIYIYITHEHFLTMAHVRWYDEMIWHHKTWWGDSLWVNLAFHSTAWQATGSCDRIVRSCRCCIPEVRWTEGAGATVDRLVSQVWQLMLHTSHPDAGVQLLVAMTREISFISLDISSTTMVLNPLISGTASPSISLLMNIDDVSVAEVSHLYGVFFFWLKNQSMIRRVVHIKSINRFIIRTGQSIPKSMVSF